MNFTNLNTYNDSHERAFEAFCNQLFERWVRRQHGGQLTHFATVRGNGGDGGVEAYAILANEDVVGVQSKWFPFNIENSQVNQIRNSINTAIKVRPKLKKYIVCLPKDLASLTARNKDETNTEEARLNSLKNEIGKLHSELDLEFWGEHELRCQLQEPGNEGIRRFWFEKSELSQEGLRRKFDIEKEGWMNERYIPSLHLVGNAEQEIENALFSEKARKRHIESIEADLAKIQEVNLLIEVFNGKVSGFPLNQNLESIHTNLEEFETALYSIKKAIERGTHILPVIQLEEVYLWEAKLELDGKKYGNTNKDIQRDLSHALEVLHKSNLSHWLTDFPNFILPHNITLMGEPGSGKTHTLAYVVEQQMIRGLPAVIIQAKTTPCNSWEDIFRYALGGLSDWSIWEICTAFEAMASRADAYRVMKADGEDLPIESTPVLIAIDGLDEALIKDYPKWKTRINELRALAKQYPRLRFLFSCRTYGIQSYNPLDLDFDDEINRRIDLTDGLSSHSPIFQVRSKVEELAPSYLEWYGIKYEGLQWLRGSFDTPLELRLFCENYKGQDVSEIVQPIHTTLKFLLSQKVLHLESEFLERFSPIWASSDQVFRKVLITISEIFMDYSGAEHDALCQEIQEKSNGIVDRIWAGKILDFVAKHGILFQKRMLDEGDALGIEKITYETTYRSYTDYFIALKASLEIGQSKVKRLPKYLSKKKQNCLNLTAISLLNDFGILIGEDGYWTEDFKEDDLHFMQYQALSEGSVRQLKSRLPILEDRFRKSREDRASILTYLVLPLSNNKELRLEKNFIHKILSSYPNSFERDLIWSGDEYHGNDDDGVPSPSETLQQIYHLETWHTHEERPLLFAWGLSCLDNNARKHFRRELAKWGTLNAGEFLKLLDLVFFCKDPQIQEDLATIALGIAGLINKQGKGLAELAKWMLVNVFNTNSEALILNSAVRYGARAVVERAFQLGEIPLPEVQRARPPYRNSHDLLPLDLSVLTDKGSYPFGNDLDWYVIDKSYDGFLELGFQGNFENETSKLLKPYHGKYKITIGPKEWAKAAAKAYIRDLGFNRTNGTTMTNESHGSLSEVMTFEEKYVWLSVHQIQGYLADLVPYKDGFEGLPEMLADYSRIVHVPNPVSRKELSKITEHLTIAGEDFGFGIVGQIGANGEWFVPEDIAPILDRTEKTLKEDLLNWVNTPQQPDFEKWINTASFFKHLGTGEPKEGVTLYGYLSLAEPNNLGRTSLQQVCFLIDSDLQAGFVKDFKKHLKKLWYEFDGLDSLEADTQATYISPEDLVWMDWVGEDSSKLEINLPSVSKNPFELINTIVKVTDRDVTEGEDYHRLPSKYVRKELGIVSMGYHSFFDINGEQIAWSMNSGRAYYDSQNFVFVEASKFEEMLNRNHLKPIWAFFQFKSTTAEFKKEHKEEHAQNCKLWLVWEEKGEFKSLLYHDGWFRKK